MVSFDDVKSGDRIRLVCTSDVYTQLRPGDTGTVTGKADDPSGRTVFVRWDSGSRLAILIDEGDVIERTEES